MIYKHEVKGAIEGSVSLRMPKYLERLEIMKDLNFESNKEGVEAAKRIDPALKLYSSLEKHIESVDLKAGDIVIKSLEELGYYQDGVRIINDLGAILIGGARLGKS